MAVKSERIYLLDLLRFIAAMAVLMSHFRNYFDKTFLEPAFQMGFLGVHAFFILSGFVIIQSARSTTSYGFFVGRFSRLVPAFVICCTLTFAISNALGDQIGFKQYLANLTFFPKSLFGEEFVDGSYWTLAYEIHFYFIVFLLSFLRSFQKAMFVFCVFWLISAAVFTFMHQGRLNQLLSASYAPLFIQGVTLSLICERATLPRLSIFVLSTLLALYNESLHINDMLDHSLIPAITILHIATVLLAIVGVPAFVYISTLYNPSRFGRIWVFLGGVSYPLYLIHQRVIHSLATGQHIGTSIAAMISMILLILLVAVTIYLVEIRVRPRVKDALISMSKKRKREALTG